MATVLAGMVLFFVLAVIAHEVPQEVGISPSCWTEDLAAQLRTLGVHTYLTETYFFLAHFAPHHAPRPAEALETRGILVKPLNDPVLGDGFMRITTALPDDNRRFVDALRDLMGPAREPAAPGARPRVNRYRL